MGKSSKAKEKKQKRLEERAAMDAVCAKVEAANKVSVPLAAGGSETSPLVFFFLLLFFFGFWFFFRGAVWF
uniref:Uncharacterized protein n=1 Tax=Bubo bubo TaxID=30461 RepID=A0A8C0EZC6_BUBBB